MRPRNRKRRFTDESVILLLVLAMIVVVGSTAITENSCITCHKEFTPELIEAFVADAHQQGELCIGCHGGNPKAPSDDMEAAHNVTGFAPLPWNGKTAAERCGACHQTVQKTYYTGPHGKALLEGTDANNPGCIGCHTPHPIRPVKSKDSQVRPEKVVQTCGKCHGDPELMRQFGLPSEVVSQYRSSVHGRALLDGRDTAAPSCTGCHDNHGAHYESVASFDQACSRCHQHEANAFKTSKHQRVWELTNAPVCITCHGNHAIANPSIEMLGTGEGTVCSKCHVKGDPPDKIRELIESLEKEFLRGQTILVKAQYSHKNVSEELATLSKVREQLEKAREALHYFNVQAIQKEVEKGLVFAGQLSVSVDDLITESSCITCHKELNPELIHAFSNDIHSNPEISCHGCHGGNPLIANETAMSVKEGYIGVPRYPGDVSRFCSRCHSDAKYMNNFKPGIPTDQASQFSLSGHGKALRRSPEDKNIANCLSCHGVHAIRAVNDPLSPTYPTNVPATCNTCHGKREMMKLYGIEIDPYSEYIGSVHGEALLERGEISAPACNDCHGNHGAQPPGVGSLGNVCGQCHTINAKLFRESIHRGIWELRGMQPCGSCHGSHAIHHPTDDMLSAAKGTFCSNCHPEGGPPDEVRNMLLSLNTEADAAERTLHRAESFLVSVDEGYFTLDKARSELTKMRVLLHRFDLDTLRTAETKTRALIKEVQDIGDAGIENANFRRRGFWVALALFLVFNIVVIFKIRDLNRR